MGLNIQEKQAVTREYLPRYQKAGKKAKPALLDEFTRLTGYHRKSDIRLLSRKPVWEVLVHGNGKAVKFKPEKKRPANHTGKRIYTDEAAASLRLVWTFFWYKRGRQTEFDADSRPPDAAADAVHRRVAGISHHRGDSEKAGNHKPRVHRPVSQEKQGSVQAEGEKSDQTSGFPEKPHPYSDILHCRRAENTGFWQIDTVHHCGQTTQDQYAHTLTADAAFGWTKLRSLFNNAHSWTFKTLSDIKHNAPFQIREFHSDNSD
jgi:hypothetical protein